MQMLLRALVLLHVAAGAVALVSFWIPALTRKGGPVHRPAGRVYVRAMSFVLATALPLSVVSFVRGEWVAGVFLFFLVSITTTALYTGRRALRSKADPASYITPIYRWLAWSNIAAGAVVMTIGVSRQIWLLAGFSLIGLLGGTGMVRFMRTPPTDPRYWFYEHFGGMIGAGIAAHVAFLNFGAQRLIPGYSLGDWGMLAWFVPVAVGLAATNRLKVHYRSRFGAGLRAREARQARVPSSSSRPSPGIT